MVYQGNEDYIFVSYAHADADRVLPIVQTLENSGFRVWFDSGIEAGTEWPEYIEERLSNSKVVLVFMTPSAVNSRNCRNEINFALELKKEMLVVYLEETTLLKGMRLQLNSTQSMFRAHHQKEETFRQALLEARILQCCRATDAPAAAPAVAPAVEPAAPVVEKKTKKNLWPILLVALLAAVAVLLCIVLLSGKGDKTDSGNPQATESQTEPTKTVVEMSDELFDYTLEMEGKVYKLPFAYQELVDDGWTISSSGYSDAYMVKGDSYESVMVSKNGKRLSISPYNLSGNAKPIKECLIGGLSWDADGGVEVKLAKGITVNSSAEEIIQALGVPTERNEYSDQVVLTYQQGDSSYNRVRFYCYTKAEEQKYSYVSMNNFVATDNDRTETNTQRPEYLDDYIQPAVLGTDFKTGNVQIQGNLYQLPAPVSVFTENGWKITQQPGFVKSGNTVSVRMEREGAKMIANLLNLAEYQTLPENCLVYEVYVESGDGVELLLPNGITMNSTKAEVEAVVTEEFSYYAGSYNYSWSYSEYDSRDFNLDIDVDVLTQTISSIRIGCVNQE